MILPGRLRLTTLGDVLGALHRDGATGVLELTEPSGRVHRISLIAGLIGHVDSSVPVRRLGDILKSQGLVDPAKLQALSERLAVDHHLRAGDVLVGMAAVTREELAAGLSIQCRERLDRLFSIEDARVAFRVARPGSAGSAVPLGPGEFLFGRARARDRLRASIPGRRRDPVRARALATLGLDDGADRSSVQRAFRKLAARLHPDRFPSAEASDKAEMIKRFAELSAAYHALVA